jgi:hypothetical protein
MEPLIDEGIWVIGDEACCNDEKLIVTKHVVVDETWRGLSSWYKMRWQAIGEFGMLCSSGGNTANGCHTQRPVGRLLVPSVP